MRAAWAWLRTMSSTEGQANSTRSEGKAAERRKWGDPGSKKAKKRAKDSVDGGPLKVAENDDAGWLVICEELKLKASMLGLGPTAITSSDPASRMAEFEAWIAQGYHGEMGFLAREDRIARRRNLEEILPDVKVCVAIDLRRGEGFPQCARCLLSAFSALV